MCHPFPVLISKDASWQPAQGSGAMILRHVTDLSDLLQGNHRIDYDDGDDEMLELDAHTWHIIPEHEDEDLIDDGGLDQLQSAAEALANVSKADLLKCTSLELH